MIMSQYQQRHVIGFDSRQFLLSTRSRWKRENSRRTNIEVTTDAPDGFLLHSAQTAWLASSRRTLNAGPVWSSRSIPRQATPHPCHSGQHQHQHQHQGRANKQTRLDSTRRFFLGCLNCATSQMDMQIASFLPYYILVHMSSPTKLRNMIR